MSVCVKQHQYVAEFSLALINRTGAYYLCRDVLERLSEFFRLTTIASFLRGPKTLQGKASTPDASRPRVLAINGDFLALRSAGVARNAKDVTLAPHALVAAKYPLTRDLELSILAPRHPGEPLPLRAIPLRIIPEFRRPRLPQFWVQIQLPRHVTGGLLSFRNLAQSPQAAISSVFSTSIFGSRRTAMGGCSGGFIKPPCRSLNDAPRW